MTWTVGRSLSATVLAEVMAHRASAQRPFLWQARSSAMLEPFRGCRVEVWSTDYQKCAKRGDGVFGTRFFNSTTGEIANPIAVYSASGVLVFADQLT